MHNGTYTISFYSTGTGDLLSTSSITVIASTLTIPLPDITWDIAFKAVENSLLPIQFYTFTGSRILNKNYLYINITKADNVKKVSLERSADGIRFKLLSEVSASWNSIAGRHEYADNTPLRGLNFYRLKTVDKDGSVSYSQMVKFVNNLVKFGVYPNPVNDNITLNIDEGRYILQITDQK